MISKSPVVFFIGFVFPEPQSSAAGSRIIQLINFFKTQGFTVVFGSAANRSEHSFDLKSIGVVEEQLNLNSNCFDDFILKLNPDIVVFDRFMTEEQFGWRVADFCPKAIRKFLQWMKSFVAKILLMLFHQMDQHLQLLSLARESNCMVL